MRILTPEQFLREIRNTRNKFDVELFRAKQDIGRQAVAHFKASFNNAGFSGDMGKKWDLRDHNYPHQILNKTGSLRDSIRVLHIGTRIVVGTDSRYSQYHNDPTGSWRRNQYSDKATIQRQFIGNSASLERWIQHRLYQVLTYTFR